jgi:hypothetical protein
MRNIFSKFALVAGITLALAFTFSCSGGDDGGNDPSNGGTSSSGGGGGKSSSVTSSSPSSSGGISSSSSGGNGSPVASLSGTWYASGERSVVFTENTFNYKVNNETVYSGTFSVSGSTMTFNTSTVTATCNFTLSADTYVISNHTDPRVNGTYTKDGSSTTPTTYSLDGVWELMGVQITISGSTGVISPPTEVGDLYYKELKSTGNLTWSGQVLVIIEECREGGSCVARGVWVDGTFTMSTDGLTLTVTMQGGSSYSLARKQ